MTDTELIQKAYEIIGNLTPLRTDCGRLCNAACCQGDDETGMLLFPGEEALCGNADGFTVTKTDYGADLLLCNGRCNREKRPLSCRIFPLAMVNKNGIIKVVVDPRCRTMCPLYTQATKDRLNPEFTKAVKEAAKVLSQSSEMQRFMEDTYRQITEFSGLFEK